jgi:hypothetical protein
VDSRLGIVAIIAILLVFTHFAQFEVLGGFTHHDASVCIMFRCIAIHGAGERDWCSSITLKMLVAHAFVSALRFWL